MRTETEFLCASASALSTSALLTSLISSLVQKNILSHDDEKAIYLNAMDTLDENAGDDPQGIFELARDLIEDQLPVGNPPPSGEPVTLTLVSAKG
jgi:hypothetical protein